MGAILGMTIHTGAWSARDLYDVQVSESWRVAAEGFVVSAVLALLVATGGAHGAHHRGTPLFAGAALMLVGLWLAHYSFTRRARAVPLWFAYAAAVLHGLLVGLHALLLMAPAEPLLTSFVLLIFLCLHSLRIWPPLVAFTGGLYAMELLLLGIYQVLHPGGAVPASVRPLSGFGPGPLLPLGVIALRPLLLLAATACLWYLVRMARLLLASQAQEFREREESLSVLTRDLEAHVEERTGQLRDAIARQATLAERERIAHELHDGLAKSVVGLALELASLVGRARSVAPDLAPQLERLAALAQRLAGEARDALADIRAPLGNGQLPDLLRADAYAFSARTGIPVDLLTEGECAALSGEVVADVRHIVVEGLENVVRHSGATRAQVRLECAKGALLICLNDDGRGLPAGLSWENLSGKRHYGLVGIRERSSRHQGEVHLIGRGPLGGLQIAVRIPIAENLTARR